LGPSDKFRFFVTCARGTEGALRREMVGLRIGSPKGDTGGVWFEGPLAMAMGVCLHARVAVRVLVQIATFEADTTDALYQNTRAIDWSRWLTTKSTLAVHATIRREPSEGSRALPRRAPLGEPNSAHAIPDSALTHSGYAALKVKDGIVDALRDKLGARPDVDAKDPDVGVVLHLSENRAGLFLDLAGEPLHRRGYRAAMVDAPLKETLAAAVLALGGVRADLPFIDPMGGSGTLAIEHAMAVRGIPPGLKRRFGFQRWPVFESVMRASWTGLVEEARERAATDAAGSSAPSLPPIVCADVAPEALKAARRNAAAAGVAGDITFEQADVGDLQRRWPEATLCTNPPYGERLAEREVGAIYRRMGSAFRRLSGWGVVVLSGNPLFAREMPGKPRINHRLYNGPLEVRLLRYELS
jgi:23S rRNA G2445 N2-methylase RlmL